MDFGRHSKADQQRASLSRRMVLTCDLEDWLVKQGGPASYQPSLLIGIEYEGAIHVFVFDVFNIPATRFIDDAQLHFLGVAICGKDRLISGLAWEYADEPIGRQVETIRQHTLIVRNGERI